MNYNMNEIDKTLPELLNMLRTAEQSINKGKVVMMISKIKTNGKRKKQHKKSKDKGKGEDPNKPDNFSLKPKGRMSKKGICFHCGQTDIERRTLQNTWRSLRRRKQ